MNDTPLIKTGHRNGHVFLRMVRVTALGRISTVARLTPMQANAIADELRDAARDAMKQRPRLKVCK